MTPELIEQQEADLIGWAILGNPWPRTIEARLFQSPTLRLISSALLLSGAWKGEATPEKVIAQLKAARCWGRGRVTARDLLDLVEQAEWLARPDFDRFVREAQSRYAIYLSDRLSAELGRSDPDHYLTTQYLEALREEERKKEQQARRAPQRPHQKTAD